VALVAPLPSPPLRSPALDASKPSVARAVATATVVAAAVLEARFSCRWTPSPCRAGPSQLWVDSRVSISSSRLPPSHFFPLASRPAPQSGFCLSHHARCGCAVPAQRLRVQSTASVISTGNAVYDTYRFCTTSCLATVTTSFSPAFSALDTASVNVTATDRRPGGWVGSSASSYLEVRFSRPYLIAGLITQGGDLSPPPCPCALHSRATHQRFPWPLPSLMAREWLWVGAWR
jgi:hypothetical protein